MEPIILISTALAAAVSAIAASVKDGLKAAGEKAGVDAYQALKKAIESRFGKQSQSAKAIKMLEDNPDSEGRQLVLKESLRAERVGEDPQIENIAKKLIQALSESQPGRQALTKYKVDAKGLLSALSVTMELFMGDSINTSHHQNRKRKILPSKTGKVST